MLAFARWLGRIYTPKMRIRCVRHPYSKGLNVFPNKRRWFKIPALTLPLFIPYYPLYFGLEKKGAMG
jgi:hypothetical protein